MKQYRQIIADQGQAYEQALKESRPGVLKKLVDSLGFLGIGVLAGILL